MKQAYPNNNILHPKRGRKPIPRVELKRNSRRRSAYHRDLETNRIKRDIRVASTTAAGLLLLRSLKWNEERLAPVLVSREFVLRLGAHDRQPLIALVQASITEWNEHFI
ncbi:hypothetical protein VTP01DRAFT_10874 [Rhizomucor pusillus]|uniref:uncharacterized protein n=1 Tax=Rhizomucor pusillus TaxID=4840 RepID=UPI0037434F01